ncbi:hypothetical protein A1Q1_06702 [Trichosporon asahii var. asahii CBS 2479]|uniref:Uncharacterized protein n=1 Tax=Trichosporon asahii var. asahii (strain ATCC 90039 / CBS 2479 / JCM 2466 / KCTC 7840 / NBRC 103889/ NCYC 2677 / UAMH 7654) TaxID=1186058 RepID=J6FA24_TRIAS|nr:hypothetical protein A1Q1_06702 [Trichosporon asahii var. asahii CBS 2479]EJT52072.1 hypothetical protein A1Q1_06702 [Trichosporon asahii var. asahii CBS 2479]
MLNKVKQSLHKHFLPPDLHKSLNAPEGVVRPKVWLDVVRGEDSNDTKRIEIGAQHERVPVLHHARRVRVPERQARRVWPCCRRMGRREEDRGSPACRGAVSERNDSADASPAEVVGIVACGGDPAPGQQGVNTAGQQAGTGAGTAAGAGAAAGGAAGAAGLAGQHAAQQQQGAALPTEHTQQTQSALPQEHAGQPQHALPQQNINQPQHALPQGHVNQPQHALPQEHANQPQHALPPGQQQGGIVGQGQQVPQQGVAGGVAGVQQGVAGQAPQGVAGQGVQGIQQQGLAQQGQQIPGQQGIAQQGVAQQGVPQQGLQQGVPQQGLQQGQLHQGVAGQQLNQQGQAPVSAQQLAPEQGGQSAPLADRFPDPPQAQPAQTTQTMQGQY